jgi:hypothetical protein
MRRAAIGCDRTKAHKHVLRVRIIIHFPVRVQVLEAGQRAPISEPAV